MRRYAVTIFLSAFLLFQIQPLITKAILPWFGGATSVWTTCLLFFQTALLGGYAYAHWTTSRLKPRAQVILHLVLLGAAALLLPILPGAGWKPSGQENPALRILALLGASIGLPFVALSTTGPLLQRWRSLAAPDASPYRLYALSNVGSLLALLTYPALVEPALTLREQSFVWSAGFVLFCAACALSAASIWNCDPADPRGRAGGRDAIGARGATGRIDAAGSRDAGRAGRSAKRADRPARGRRPPGEIEPNALVRLLWLILAANGSLMLLAVTNQMCQDVASVPFLWILPLALYLISFIICFDNDRWYSRRIFWTLEVVGACGMVWALARWATLGVLEQVVVMAFGLFAACMVSHGELVRLKPPARHLTSFYLRIAAGGALGAVFVSLVAPRIFKFYLELNLGISSTFAIALVAYLYGSAGDEPASGRAWPVGWVVAAAVGIVALNLLLTLQALGEAGGYTVATRNFYGVLRVGEYDADEPLRHRYKLLHGRISHGWQFVAESLRRTPTAYFGEASGAGLAFGHARGAGPIKVGVCGLGVGTLAAYGRPGDLLRFYEINPDVTRLATSVFTYLADSGARHEVVPGDARLSLEREPPQDFDLLFLDAFNGDAVPMHLLTREAFEVYRRHLKPGGVIAVNITNLHVDLAPVVWGVGERLGYQPVMVDSPGDPEGRTSAARWVLLTDNKDFLGQPEVLAAAAVARLPARRVLWTDSYSNLFTILKWR